MPRVLLDEKSLLKWQIWCGQTIGTNACQEIMPSAEFARAHVPIQSENKCANLANNDKQIKSEADVELLKECLEQASKELQKLNKEQLANTKLEEQRKHAEGDQYLRQQIADLFDNGIFTNRLIAKLDRDLMSREEGVKTFWENVMFWKKDEEGDSAVPPIKYVPYKRDILVTREVGKQTISLNTKLLEAEYPPRIGHMIREAYDLAEKNLLASDFYKKLNGPSGGNPAAAVQDIKGHVSQLYVLIQLRRTICQLFLEARDDKERAELEKANKPKWHWFSREVRNPNSRQIDAEGTNRITLVTRSAEEQLERPFLTSEAKSASEDGGTNRFKLVISEAPESGMEARGENMIVDLPYKEIIRSMEKTCNAFYERNKQERAYFRWSPTFKAMDDLHVYNMHSEQQQSQTHQKHPGGLRMRVCDDGKFEPDGTGCEYKEYDKLLEKLLATTENSGDSLAVYKLEKMPFYRRVASHFRSLSQGSPPKGSPTHSSPNGTPAHSSPNLAHSSPNGTPAHHRRMALLQICRQKANQQRCHQAEINQIHRRNWCGQQSFRHQKQMRKKHQLQ